MKTNSMSRKGFALLLAVAMMLALIPAVASAADSVTISVGQTQGGYYVQNQNSSGYGTITSVSSSNPAYVTATGSGSTFSVYGVAAGTSVVTVYYTDTNTQAALTDTLTVTVSGTSTTSSNLTVAVGGTVNTGTLGQIVAVTPANTAIATATNNTSYVTVTGVSAGTTTVSVLYYASGSATASTANYTVTVTGTGTYTGTGGTSAVSQPFSLEVGKNAEIPSVVAATNIVSSNPAVGTAAIENGKMVLRGLSAGTTEITFNGSTTVGGTATAYKIALTVTGTGTATAGGSTTGSGGVTFSKTSTSVTSGKNYRLKGMKVNSSSVVAADLRWMSTDTDVLTVNAKTGVFKGKTSGTAYLIAADPDTGAVGSIKVEIN